MIKKLCVILLSLLVVVPTMASADEDDAIQYYGSIGLGLMSGDINSSNGAKFEKYRDMGNGVLGVANFSAVKNFYFVQVDANNIGFKDQSIDLRGGGYGLFKYNLYYDEMPHNYSTGLSPLAGIGSNRLTLPLTAPPVTASTDNYWSPFDYSVKHKKYGGQVEIMPGGPFFLNFGVERRQQKGTRPYSISSNEVPLPILYSTDNFNVKAGYLGKTITASVSGYLSSFNNDYLYMTRNVVSLDAASQPITTTTNAVAAPENKMYKVAGDFSWRGLPLKSTLAMSASYTGLSNSFTASEVNVTPTATWNRINSDGNIKYNTFSVAVVSQPLPKLDSRIHYRYVNRDDKTSRFANGSNNNGLKMLSYNRNAAGIELGYRLPQRTKLSFGYDYENIDRSTPLSTTSTTNRYESPRSTTDHSFFAKVKNSSLDWMTATLKYKHSKRSSDYSSGRDPYANYLEIIRLDAADKSTDQVKLGLDFLPFERLNFGINFMYQKDNYDYNQASRDSDERENVYFDVTWRPWKKMSLNTFVGFEHTKTRSNRISTAATAIAPGTIYGQMASEDFWTYGITLDLPDVIDRLSFRVSWQYERSNGRIKYDNNYLDVGNSTNYNRQTLNAKAIYAFDKHLSMTAIYLFERLHGDDVALANYQYINGTNLSTGLYYDQNYVAHIGYALLAYSF